MDIPLQDRVRDHVRREGLPRQVYAAVGATMLLREQAAALPDRVTAAGRGLRRQVDEWTTTGYQMGFEARERVAAAPDRAATAARQAAERTAEIPGEARDQAKDQVIDLRDTATSAYHALAASGERALTEWQAERALNRRAERMTRSVTPTAAKATVSARDAARRAAESPTGAKVREAGVRARVSAKKAWDGYLAAVDEAESVPVATSPPAPHVGGDRALR